MIWRSPSAVSPIFGVAVWAGLRHAAADKGVVGVMKFCEVKVIVVFMGVAGIIDSGGVDWCVISVQCD